MVHFYPWGRGGSGIALDLPKPHGLCVGGTISPKGKEKTRLFSKELGVDVRQTKVPVSSLLSIELLKD